MISTTERPEYQVNISIKKKKRQYLLPSIR